MGRALAGLSELPWEGSGLTIYDADTFGQAHRRPVSELEGPLREAMTDIEDFDRLTSLRVPSRSPLVLTHGDPGPGNFLDDGRTGTLIDWEEAQVAPRGLDLARAMFIALLGSGPSGFVARNSNARSRSVATGYLTGLRDGWEPASSELRWWLTVAGVQFAHRRRERAGQPGVRPFTEAIAVFAGALRDNGAWMPG
jgi:aminoglycoside phosphotransferase (APT) family kinase protein